MTKTDLGFNLRGQAMQYNPRKFLDDTKYFYFDLQNALQRNL